MVGSGMKRRMTGRGGGEKWSGVRSRARWGGHHTANDTGPSSGHVICWLPR